MLFTAQRPSPTVAAKRIFISIGLGALLFALINSIWSPESFQSTSHITAQSIECADTIMSTSDDSGSMSSVLDAIHCRTILYKSIVEGY